MSLDPTFAPLLIGLGKAAYDWIQELHSTKIVINKGLTFYHRDSELEFTFLVSLNETRSKLNKIVKKIQSTTGEPLTFQNVTCVMGHGMESNEDLVALGAISLSESSAKIDFSKLYDLKSNTFLIQVRSKANEQLKQLLVSNRIEKSPQNTGKQIEAYIDVALDYANLWHKIFDQYTVRDIDFIFTLTIDLETILKQIPRKQAKRISKAAELAVCGNTSAIQFLKIMTKSFLLYESDEMITRLQDSISVEPQNFVLKELYPSMQPMEIPNTGYPVVLPGKMRLRMGCVLDGNQITARGKLVIDIEKFSEVLHEIIQDIQKKTLRLKF